MREVWRGRDGFGREEWLPVLFLHGARASVEERPSGLGAPNPELVIKP